MLLHASHTELNETYTFLIECMNLDEAVELLRTVSAIPLKEPAKHPEIRIFHNIGEGYTLRIKTEAVNAEYRNHLKEIVESSRLTIRESKHYLIIHGHPVQCSL